MQYFRPEKEEFELMRAVLPHLRLLTLPVEQLTELNNYLKPEEKVFLAVQMVFDDENSSGPSPQSLNTNTTPREKAVVVSLPSVKLELIPEKSITTDHLKMPGQPLHKSKCDQYSKEVFKIEVVDVSQNVCLTGIEILTRGNNQPQFKQGAGVNSDR